MEDGKKGKLIILDGIDGCGGETQTRILKERLEKEGEKVKLFSFPNYDRPIGKLLDNYLNSSYELEGEVLALIYYADFVDARKKIQKALEEGFVIICDRYLTSTITYQDIQGVDVNNIISLTEKFAIPKPDIAIYLSISPETSAKRKFAEKGNLDRHEKDLIFLDKVIKKYIKNAENNVYCKQQIIDAEKPIDEVAQNIYSAIIPIIKDHQ
ncbi:dTMP kinase [bacterium]|nr:dTMP kinase [bacterium]